MRRQELIGLNVGDINTEKKVVTIKTAKSKGVRPYRLIPYDLLDSEAVKAVLVWLKARERILKEKPVEDDKALFIAYKTNKILGKRFSLQGLGEVFARVSNKAGFTVEEYVNPHSLRHHFGHVIAKRVKNPYIVSGSLGHASLQSSMRYTQLEDGDLVDTLRNGE